MIKNTLYEFFKLNKPYKINRDLFFQIFVCCGIRPSRSSVYRTLKSLEKDGYCILVKFGKNSFYKWRK